MLTQKQLNLLIQVYEMELEDQFKIREDLEFMKMIKFGGRSEGRRKEKLLAQSCARARHIDELMTDISNHLNGDQ